MPWGVAAAVVAAAGSAYAANKQSSAANKAAKAQQGAADAATAEQRRQYDQSRQDMLPFMQAGYGALDKQNAILNGDYSGFMNSPDYQFALDQGTKFMDRSAASRGSLYSAGHSADMMKYGQGLATQNLNNYWGKLAGQANQSYNAGSFMGGLGSNMANNIGNNLNNAANARASSYAAGANAWGGAANSIAGIASGALNQYGAYQNGGYNYGGGASVPSYSSIGSMPSYQVNDPMPTYGLTGGSSW